MPATDLLPKEKRKKNIDIRAALLIIQILLPFGLYFALGWVNQVPVIIISGVFVLSVIVMTWLG